jgi:hypothetical protein
MQLQVQGRIWGELGPGVTDLSASAPRVGDLGVCLCLHFQENRCHISNFTVELISFDVLPLSRYWSRV